MSNKQSMEHLEINHVKMNTQALDYLLSQQKRLDSIYGQRDYSTWAKRQGWLLKIWMALEDELNEFKNWLGWKWWSKKIIDEKKARLELEYEMIDMLHFWLSACDALEMDSQRIIDLYTTKNKENYDRQTRGY